MLQELILSASYGTLGLHDLTTGATALNFKNANLTSTEQSHAPQASSSHTHTPGGTLPPRKTTGYVETSDGQGGFVTSVGGQGKGAVSVWSYAKEAPLQRSLMAVRLSTMALSPSGIYLAGGSHDGRILIWQISTGALLTSFDAHYRAITCLAWTSDAAALVSGSEDALLHVWSLPGILSSRRDPNLPPAPYATLSDHTLPITDVSIGMGIFPRIRLMSASSDGSCKLWDLTIPTLPLLTTFNFPAPAQVTHLSLDPSERFFFACYCKPVDSLAEKGQASTSKEKRTSVVQRVDLFDGSESIGGTGQGDMVNVSESNTYTSTDQITALHLSRLSPHLLIGTSTSQIHILALPSLQSIRTITLGAGQTLPSPNPVTYLATMARPVDLAGVGKTGQKESVLVRTVAQLGREVQSSEQRKSEVCWVRLSENEDVRLVTKLIAPHLTRPTIASQPSSQTVAAARPEVNSDVQTENAKLKEQLAKALHMNERMWSELVERNLGTE